MTASTSPLVAAPDPRTDRPGLCGITRTGATGIEWICIRPVHAKWEDRHRPAYDSRGNPAQAERHYFVRRYPYRPTRQEGTTNP